MRVVSDQIGAPTSAQALAEATAELLKRHGAKSLGDARGIYHVTAGGSTSWHVFATEIARLERPNFPVRVLPLASSEYSSPACSRGRRRMRAPGAADHDRIGGLPSAQAGRATYYVERISNGRAATISRRPFRHPVAKRNASVSLIRSTG